MLKPSRKIFYVILICSFVSLTALLDSGAVADNEQRPGEKWIEYKKMNNITGYERKVQGSKYLESRAVAVVDAPIEVLFEMLKDIPSYPRWMYECTEAVPLKQDGEFKRVLYFSQGVHMFSPDRDAVIEAFTVVDGNKGSIVTTLNSIENYPYKYLTKENQKKRVRMVEFRGMWDLRMIDRNRTKVVYSAYTSPGGFAPALVVNGVIRKVSFRSLKAMIALSKDQKYVKAAEKSEAKKIIEAAIENGSLVFSSSFQSNGASLPE